MFRYSNIVLATVEFQSVEKAERRKQHWICNEKSTIILVSLYKFTQLKNFNSLQRNKWLKSFTLHWIILWSLFESQKILIMSKRMPQIMVDVYIKNTYQKSEKNNYIQWYSTYRKNPSVSRENKEIQF